jgi:hypothetical protein
MNAVTELQTKLKEEKINYLNIACARIMLWNDGTDARKVIVLKQGWTGPDWDRFLIQMNFEYDEGFGSQYIFGTIWLLDGTWLSRGEYDGSEWWQYNKTPEIPNDVK